MSTVHNIDLKHNEAMTFSVSQNGHTFLVDADEAVGGQDKGPRPKALILSALAGCTAMDVVSLLRKMKVNFEQLSISVSGELTEEHPKTYHLVNLEYTIKIDDEEGREKMQKAVDLSQTKYCGVAAMMKSFATLNYSIKYI